MLPILLDGGDDHARQGHLVWMPIGLLSEGHPRHVALMVNVRIMVLHRLTTGHDTLPMLHSVETTSPHHEVVILKLGFP